MLALDDTIAAIASPPGGALRGIVRISGTGCLQVVERVFTCSNNEKRLSDVRLPACTDGEIRLPRELGTVPARLYFWPGIRSYTREPTAEFHLIGSPPLMNAALEALCKAGARLARPGEFTLRAFLAGRLDLTQAEAVLGVIDARSPHELQTALHQLAGGLAGPLAALRFELLDLLAHLEAGLDFVDEDIEFITAAELDQRLAEIAGTLESIQSQMQSRADSNALARVVLVGEPNAGKSSLLNALAGQDAAIVSSVRGTTRDYVTCRISLEGVECLLTDTAGVETNQLEAIGARAQSAAGEQIEQADLIVLCVDASRAATAWEQSQLAAESAIPRVIVLTKCDLLPEAWEPPRKSAIPTSSHGGTGLYELRTAIGSVLSRKAGEGVVASTSIRCHESLAKAAESLERARQSLTQNTAEELVAAEMRMALDELGQVIGAVYTDDVLDRIFSRFCIGK